ncbi:unnamed protein product, partial [Choristocarpus tenellus]
QSRFPSINRVVESIQKRKLRDNCVLASVIAACICFTIWYEFGAWFG